MKKIILIFSTIVSIIATCVFPDMAQAKDSEGNIVIVVDAGHGSIDGGANQNGVKESLVNWELALALKAELQTYWGVEVYLTRGSSEWHSNTGRGRFGLEVNADFGISLHNNSSNTPSVGGVEVYGTLNPSYSTMTKTIGTDICANISALGLKNRGYKTRQSGNDARRDFYTFIDEGARAGIPSIIVEHAFLSNAGDAAFISNADNQKKVSTATATAIAKYFGLSKRGVTAGESISLTRTYSATVMNATAGTFVSDNTGVAVVDSNGIITAVGTGSANISYTDTSGNAQNVTVNVPAVELVALSAGISPTFYNPTENINNSNIIVKAVYSDGSVKQIKDYTIKETPYSSNGIYDIPITYNGVTGHLRVYKTGSLGTYTGGAAYTYGNNTDILKYPQLYQGINTGINIVNTPVYSTHSNAAPELYGIPNAPGAEAGGQVVPPTQAPTAPPTEAPTEKPTIPPTEAPTTEAPTTEVPTTEEVTTASQDTEATTEDVNNSEENTTEEERESTTEGTTKAGDNEELANKYKKLIIIILVAVAVLMGGTVVVVIVAMRKK